MCVRDVPTMHMHKRVNGSLCVCICVSLTGETLIRGSAVETSVGKTKGGGSWHIIGTVLCVAPLLWIGIGLSTYELYVLLKQH